MSACLSVCLFVCLSVCLQSQQDLKDQVQEKDALQVEHARVHVSHITSSPPVTCLDPCDYTSWVMCCGCTYRCD